jgi:hypothetical protein
VPLNAAAVRPVRVERFPVVARVRRRVRCSPAARNRVLARSPGAARSNPISPSSGRRRRPRRLRRQPTIVG